MSLINAIYSLYVYYSFVYILNDMFKYFNIILLPILYSYSSCLGMVVSLHSTYAHLFCSCWLSEADGTIWAFVAPMLLIILVSLMYIVHLVLTTLYVGTTVN